MSVSRIALRYAAPLLNLAREQKIEDWVKADMQTFSMICRNNRDFRMMLKSPVIPPLRKVGILRKIFEHKVHDITLRFLDLAVRKNRANILEEAANQFLKSYNEAKGLQEATVVTSFPLDKTLRRAFEQLVKSLSGKDPVLTEQVDKRIIGGYQLALGDKKIDASVRGQLNTLKLKFTWENN